MQDIFCKDCQHWEDKFSECTGCTTEDFEIDLTCLDDQGLDYHLKTGPFFGCKKFIDKNGNSIKQN